MITYKDYVAGWLNLSVSHFLNDFPSTYERMQYSLITCVDSNKNPASLLEQSPELELLRPGARSLGQGLLVPTKKILAAHHHNKMFFGFDEIWFFPSEPLQPKPDTAWLVGPARVEDRTLNALGSWMTANSCTLALGGGTGLNFVLKARGLVKYFVGISTDQPSVDDVLTYVEYEVPAIGDPVRLAEDVVVDDRVEFLGEGKRDVAE